MLCYEIFIKSHFSNPNEELQQLRVMLVLKKLYFITLKIDLSKKIKYPQKIEEIIENYLELKDDSVILEILTFLFENRRKKNIFKDSFHFLSVILFCLYGNKINKAYSTIKKTIQDQKVCTLYCLSIFI